MEKLEAIYKENEWSTDQKIFFEKVFNENRLLIEKIKEFREYLNNVKLPLIEETKNLTKAIEIINILKKFDTHFKEELNE